MSCRDYSVVPNGDDWSVQHQGCKAGRYRTRAEAMRVAVRLAREAYNLGEDVYVSIEDRNGRKVQERVFDHAAPTVDQRWSKTA